MNKQKLDDMYYHCENETGGYSDISYLEKLQWISGSIDDYNNGEITEKELIKQISDGKCPFLKNGLTIDGLCFTEAKFTSPQQNKEILDQCLRCWEEFLEV
jgi:hypothetical protein